MNEVHAAPRVKFAAVILETENQLVFAYDTDVHVMVFRVGDTVS